MSPRNQDPRRRGKYPLTQLYNFEEDEAIQVNSFLMEAAKIHVQLLIETYLVLIDIRVQNGAEGTPSNVELVKKGLKLCQKYLLKKELEERLRRVHSDLKSGDYTPGTVRSENKNPRRLVIQLKKGEERTGAVVNYQLMRGVSTGTQHRPKVRNQTVTNSFRIQFNASIPESANTSVNVYDW